MSYLSREDAASFLRMQDIDGLLMKTQTTFEAVAKEESLKMDAILSYRGYTTPLLNADSVFVLRRICAFRVLHNLLLSAGEVVTLSLAKHIHSGENKLRNSLFPTD